MSQQQLNQMSSYLRQLEKKFDNLQSEMSSIRIGGDLPASLPGQYAGKPIPSIEAVEIDIAATTNKQNGNITLTADGPFVARAIHFAWKDGTSNKWRPISSARDFAGTGVDILDFYFEYSATGSRRNRQNIPIPSALIDDANQGNGMFTFLMEDTFDPTATIVIGITPTVAPDHAGVLWVGFSGAYILQ